MNYCYRVFTLTLLIVCCTFALTATVKNQAGVPLPGVAVSFTKADTTVYSDSNGVVYCDIITPIVTPQTSLNSASLRFNGSGFSLSLPIAMDVSLSLYSPRGQEIMHHSETMKNGNHLIVPPTIADGIYLMKLQVGEEQFTSKIVRGQRVNWQGSVLPGLMHSGRAADFIDTVSFSKSGFTTLLKPIESYKADLGAVTLDSVLLNNNYFGLQKYDIDTTLPSFVNVLFRVYDTLGNNISSITADKLLIKEDGEPISSAESELTLETVSDFKDSTQTVLLIDNSKSVEANLPKIKAAAKEMIRNLIPRQQVAVYAFSENCVKVQAFTSDTTALIQAIDAIPAGYSSTNLYGSLITAFADVDNHADVKLKEIMFGNVVLFTDGKDTQGSSTLAQVLAAQGDIRVFAVGFGQEIDLGMDALKEIALDNVYTTTDPDKLGILFKEVQTQISNVANSYYWAHYRSPKRGDVDHTLTVGIKSNENSKKDATITGTFNSKHFQAGWAPTAKNLKIELNATSDTLIASYEYEDKDGEAEGDSKIHWLVNGEDVNCDSLAIPTSQLDDGDSITFNIQPVSILGSPNIGELKSKKVQISMPIGYTYGGINCDSNSTIISAKDGYILLGESGEPGKFVDSFLIVKVNDNGDTIWTKTYSYKYKRMKPTCAIPVDDGSIITGVKSTGTNGTDAYLLKIDINGDTLWSKTYGTKEDEEVLSITPCSDGFLLTGRLGKSDLIDYYDGFILKVSENGDSLWSKTFGGSDFDVFSGAIRVSDGYVIGGSSCSYSGGENDIWLVKVDFNGDSVWSKTYGTQRWDYVNTIMQNNNGYIIAGLTTNEKNQYNHDVWFIKIDQNGDSLWTKTYERERYWIEKSIPSDGGFVIVGSTNTQSSASADVWLMKIDGSCNIVWEKTYSGSSYDIGKAVVQTSDGYLVSGHTQSFGAGDYDMLLIKTDKNGNSNFESLITIEE